MSKRYVYRKDTYWLFMENEIIAWKDTQCHI